MTPYELMLSESPGAHARRRCAPVASSRRRSASRRWQGSSARRSGASRAMNVPAARRSAVVVELPLELLVEQAPRVRGRDSREPSVPPGRARCRPVSAARRRRERGRRRAAPAARGAVDRVEGSGYTASTTRWSGLPPSFGRGRTLQSSRSRDTRSRRGDEHRRQRRAGVGSTRGSGAAHAVAEAARNVVCQWRPPARRHRLPELLDAAGPGRHAAIAEAVAGIAAACTALGMPVVSGNVSLYNRAGDIDVLPTPVVGVLGVVERPEHVTPSRGGRAAATSCSASGGAATMPVAWAGRSVALRCWRCATAESTAPRHSSTSRSRRAARRRCSRRSSPEW